MLDSSLPVLTFLLLFIFLFFTILAASCEVALAAGGPGIVDRVFIGTDVPPARGVRL